MLRHFGRAAEPKAWAMATAASKVSDPTTGANAADRSPRGSRWSRSDDSGRGDLLGGVAAVSAVHAHVDGLQQAELEGKHLHAQVRGPGEVADGQRQCHRTGVTLPLCESQTANPLLTLP
jgi:hypothetical protein